MKYKTVREGEQAVIYNHLGEGRLVVGPSRVFLFRERLQKLAQHTATQYQYLILKHNSGLVSHVPGPCQMYLDPLEHSYIQVADATKIDANHMVIVYRKLKDHSVERRVVQGPTVLVPEAEEWLHEFVWHGTDPQDKSRMIPGHRVFTQLAAIPDQFYYNVNSVRTNDDTMLTVKLMVFYELKDVITMLESTQDPIADLINAVCADVISFAGRVTFEGFLQGTHKLSDLDHYKQLLQRSHKIGYKVNKVVYRGYHSSDQLQGMQDSAIQSRTQLRMHAELEEQRQRLTDFQLQREQARSNSKQEMKRKQVEHQQKLDKLRETHKLELKMREHNTKLECDRMLETVKLECDKAKNARKVAHLQQLGELNVDLTKYLATQGPIAVDQEIRVVTPSVHGSQNTEF